MRALIAGLFLTVVLIGWRAGGTARPDPAVASAAPPAEDWHTPHQSGGTLALDRDTQGHFFVNGDVAGTSIRFVIDTGATEVAIGREDAQRLGVLPPDAAFDIELRTASGTITGAHVTLPRLRIGDIQMLNVHAIVVNVPETLPMLGQSFLSRLDSVTITGDRMILAKR